MILTDANGRPIPRPERADFATDLDYLRASCAYNDRVNALASGAFDRAFRRAVKERSR